MAQELTIALVSISSAFLGTIIGGLISYFSSKHIKTIELDFQRKKELRDSKANIASKFARELFENIRNLENDDIETVSISQRELMAYFFELQLFFESTAVNIGDKMLTALAKLSFEEEGKITEKKKELLNEINTLNTSFVKEVRKELEII